MFNFNYWKLKTGDFASFYADRVFFWFYVMIFDANVGIFIIATFFRQNHTTFPDFLTFGLHFLVIPQVSAAIYYINLFSNVSPQILTNFYLSPGVPSKIKFLPCFSWVTSQKSRKYCENIVSKNPLCFGAFFCNGI